MSEHTKAAIRCADAVIWRDGHHNPHPVNTGEKLAAIIDRETGLPSVLWALKLAREVLSDPASMDNRFTIETTVEAIDNALRKAGEL